MSSAASAAVVEGSSVSLTVVAVIVRQRTAVDRSVAGAQ